MKARIEIRMDNDAFVGRPGSELARILREIADQAEAYDGAEDFREFTHPLRDTNGNSIGGIEVTGRTPENITSNALQGAVMGAVWIAIVFLVCLRGCA